MVVTVPSFVPGQLLIGITRKLDSVQSRTIRSLPRRESTPTSFVGAERSSSNRIPYPSSTLGVTDTGPRGPSRENVVFIRQLHTCKRCPVIIQGST